MEAVCKDAVISGFPPPRLQRPTNLRSMSDFLRSGLADWYVNWKGGVSQAPPYSTGLPVACGRLTRRKLLTCCWTLRSFSKHTETDQRTFFPILSRRRPVT